MDDGGYKNGNKWCSLASQVKHGFPMPKYIPTPRAGAQEGYQNRSKRKGHDVAMSYLESAVEHPDFYKSYLPTPISGEYRDTGPSMADQEYKQQNLTRTIATTDKEQWNNNGCALNPYWVEWFMSFPIGWTDTTIPTQDLYREHIPDLFHHHPPISPVAPSVPGRAARIKQLGNAIAPHQILPIFQAIDEQLKLTDK